MPPDPDATMIEEEMLAAERGAAFRAAFDTLPSGCRALLSLLASDPPPGYAEISETLGVAVGSIGPMRARCLDRLRRSPQVASLADTPSASPAPGRRGVGRMTDAWTDEELLAELRQALKARQAVPPSFVEALRVPSVAHHRRRASQLTYDSLATSEAAPVTRSEPASIRSLTFTSPRLTIELEVAGGTLLGQVVPPRPRRSGCSPGRRGTVIAATRSAADRRLPRGPFRLRCQTDASVDVLTGWITL